MKHPEVVPREMWQPLAPGEFGRAEMREGAARAHGLVEAYRVKVVLAGRPQTLELLWIPGTQRAAIGSADGVLWTTAPSVEAALEAWAAVASR